MKIVQNLIKVPPVNSEVLVDLKNIEGPVKVRSVTMKYDNQGSVVQLVVTLIA